MNVLLLIPQLKGGGAELLVSRLSRELESHVSLYIATFESSQQDFPNGGTRIAIPPHQGRFGVFSRLVQILKRVKAVRKIKKTYQIHLTVSFMLPADLVNTLSLGKDKKIVTVHSNMSAAVKGSPLMKGLYRFLYNRADKIVAVSHGSKADLCSQFQQQKEKVAVIHNLIEMLDGMHERSHGQAFTVCTAGSFRYPKGHWHLLKAFKIVHDQRPDTVLVIAGEGVMYDHLRQLASGLGLEKAVSFPGFIEDIAGLFAASDVFVFSSIYEGFGNVLVEAMSTGLPVISTDCPFGPREILSDDLETETQEVTQAAYGILTRAFPIIEASFEPGETTLEERLLAKAILLLLSQPDLQKHYSAIGKERAVTFSARVIVPQWLALIEGMK